VNQDSVRNIYRDVLNANECVSKYINQIIPRNTCRTPWTNSLDMRFTRGFSPVRGQRAELQVDLFNVLNGVGRLFCSEGDFAANPTQGTCGWGRRTTISGANQNLFISPTTQNGQVFYTPNRTMGRETVLGSNLQLQFQAQIGLRYTF
jgi:hypothetical protein